MLVAVGAQTRAARRAAALPASHPLYTPPPIPAGAYNPIRDIELSAGKRGLQNTVEDAGTSEARGQSNYLLGAEGIQRQQGEQATSHQESLDSLARSYQRLQGRQAEQAREAGVTRGGAVLQSAAKRAANEGTAKAGIETAYGEQQAADQRSLAQLGLGRQREGEDNTTTVQRAEREQGQFGVDTQTLEAREASENGYTAPVPSAFSRTNSAGQGYRQFKNAKGQTVHEYADGRKVIL